MFLVFLSVLCMYNQYSCHSEPGIYTLELKIKILGCAAYQIFYFFCLLNPLLHLFT
jgi:hypothetical protein